MFIGVDAGTSMVKAVAFDRSGEILATSHRPATTHVPNPGYAEQHLSEIVAATGATVREVARQLRSKVEILAVTAHGDGAWLMDAAGEAVRPGIVWSDARAASIVSDWERDGTAERAFRLSGNVPFAGSAAALIRYLAELEPASLEAAATVGYPKDAIHQCLTGARATDITDASLPFLDPHTRDYSPELLDLFGVSPWRHLLAPIDPAPGVIRPLNPAGALLTGLPVGTPVHSGPFDFPATTIGAGVTEPGDGLIALGTTLACGVLKDRFDSRGEPSGMTISMPGPAPSLRLLPAMAGTLALDWVLPLLGATHRDLELLLEQSRPGAEGVMMLPYVAPAGERAPFVDPGARGRIIGLSTSTSRADVARAVCEGIAYAARHCLEAGGLSEVGEVSLSGGGSRTPNLQQILANVLGRTVRIARQPEAGARGTVIAGLRAADIEIDADEWTRPDGKVEPDPRTTSLYADGYAHYLEEIERARGAWAGPRG